jgi:hypothetical protein
VTPRRTRTPSLEKMTKALHFLVITFALYPGKMVLSLGLASKCFGDWSIHYAQSDYPSTARFLVAVTVRKAHRSHLRYRIRFTRQALLSKVIREMSAGRRMQRKVPRVGGV